jgi:rhamnogalacturonan endolyase
MKKTFLFLTMALSASFIQAQVTPTTQMEKLDRGVVAVKGANGGNFVSWRLLGTDDERNTSFTLLRGKVTVAENTTSTSYNDTNGGTGAVYTVITKVNGEPVDTSTAVKAFSEVYWPVTLDRPANGSNASGSYDYSPNDMSIGDVDGDGQMELFVKWDPSNSKDNSQDGYTGNVYIDCYKLNMTELTAEKLWRVDLGVNIRAGAHYTQFMVYDFDGDGRAEMILKTAPGSKDGLGEYVSNAATNATIQTAGNTSDYRNSAGRVNGGYEYLTVFEGLTGKALHTIPYNPNRNQSTALYAGEGTFNWDDRSGKTDKGSYGNRGERYLAAVAYLDGPDGNPSAIFTRGYYTYAFLWAVDFDGQHLLPRWAHRSNARDKYTVVYYNNDGSVASSKTYTDLPAPTGHPSGSRTMYGNGNHNLSVADVDGDGKDEIIWGSAACNDDGTLLYATGFGHGDAIHVSDLDPTRPGLEVFEVHEDQPAEGSWDVHDAATGQVIHVGGNAVDNGRGIAAQLSADHYGFYFSSSDDRQQRSAVTGEVVSTKSTSLNFRIYWDGDLQDELLDGTQIDKWNGNGTTRLLINGKNPYDWNNSQSCNSTKKTPNLQCDLFGDWREELILWNGEDKATLNIFTTNTASNFKVPTLLHDHVYRMGICWQNVAYNQPPHLGYYLPDRFRTKVDFTSGGFVQTVALGDSITPVEGIWTNTSAVGRLSKVIMPDGTELTTAPEGFTFKTVRGTKGFSLTGKPEEMGQYKFCLTSGKNILDQTTRNDTISIIVSESVDMIVLSPCTNSNVVEYYDLSGRRQQSARPGFYIVRQGNRVRKVVVK